MERLAGARGKVEQRWISLAWILPDDGVEPLSLVPDRKWEEGVGSSGQGGWEDPLGTLEP